MGIYFETLTCIFVCLFISFMISILYRVAPTSLHALRAYVGPIREDDSIFVSVASYRDTNCHKTIQSMYETANNPSKVFVGICQQNHRRDIDCIKSLPKNKNIRIIRLKYTRARGPCFARYLCSCLYNGETYYIQIDSHTVFTTNWDVKLVNMMKSLPDNAIISHYPLPVHVDTFGPPSDVPSAYIPVTCGVSKDDDMLRFKSMMIPTSDIHPVVPNRQTIGTAAGFLCMTGNAVQKVPFDKNLDMIFIAEELLYSARLFTHGFDFYPPTENLVYHYYERKGEPKFWDDVKVKPIYNDSETIHNILEYHNTGSNLGLGTERHMDEYWKLIGYDKHTKELSRNTCETN